MKDTIKKYIGYIKIYLLGAMSVMTILSFVFLVWFKYEITTDEYFIKAQQIISQRKVKNEN